MGLYKLTAKKKGARGLVYRFVATDDDDATMIAVFKVLAKASAQHKAGLTDGAWCIGKITLSDSEGRVIRTMASKEKTSTSA
jgi:hypothetical protein